MDERLEKALEFSNYMVTLNNQKRLLNEKYQEDLLYFHSGSQFTVTKELVTFVGMLVDKEQDGDIVLIDDNGIPCLVSNAEEFLDDIMNIYFSASNNFYSKYIELKKKRSVEALVEYDKN